MAVRKTKVPIKQLPKISEWLLRSATGEQLAFLERLSRVSDIKLIVGLVSKLKDYNVYEVFNYPAPTDNDLALYRAAKRGEVAGLDALIMAIQGAKVEIERRKQKV